MQTRSPSNPSNSKRAESPDNSCNYSTDSPGYSSTSPAYLPTSQAYSPPSPEPSVSGSKAVSKDSHQRYNRDSKPQAPAKPSPFAAFKLSSTGRPIPFKGRARSINQCWTRQYQVDLSFRHPVWAWKNHSNCWKQYCFSLSSFYQQSSWFIWFKT